jgi:hypothetical protein
MHGSYTFAVAVSLRRSVRAAEGARLESVCTSQAYRGFESHLLRHFSAHLNPIHTPTLQKIPLHNLTHIEQFGPFRFEFSNFSRQNH